NARVTMELYQALTNSNYLNFPRYKGFLTQAEIEYSLSTNNPYSNFHYIFPITLNLSSVYGLPVNMKLGIVTSAFFNVPLNKNYNYNIYHFAFHSPIFLQYSL